MTIASSGAGHGGLKTNGQWRDSGAVGTGHQEADVARTINAKIIAKTKVSDTTDNAGTSQNDNLAKIAAKINAGPDGWALSNHLNCYNGTASGIEVLYGSPSSADMASKVSAAIASVLGLPNRGAKDGSWLSIARHSNAGKKVILIEWGFIDNANDMAKLMSKMDQAIDAALSCFGYATSASKPSAPVVKQPTITQGTATPGGGFRYRAHIANQGWLGWVGTEEMAGSTGHAIPMQALQVSYGGATDLITGKAHVQQVGWLPWDYGTIGTVGKNLRLEAVQLWLGQFLTDKGYNLQYRVHVGGIGWQNWVNNGGIAGTVGKGRAIEAIQMRLLKNGIVEKGHYLP